MNWSASVLSTVSSDTEPSVVITFDSAKYVFNAGENTGRTWVQSRRYWRRTRALFMTSVGTQRGSGVPGLLMFLADATIPKLDIVGPRGLMHFLAQMRSYLFRDSMSVNPVEAYPIVSAEPQPVFKDENLTVYGIPLTVPVSPLILAESPSAPTESASAPAKKSLVAQALELLDEDSNKRKRSPSPTVSSKRANLGDASGTGTYAAMGSLEERMHQPGFSPTELTGEEAQTWRRLAMSGMFRRDAPLEKSTGKGKGKKQEEPPSVVSPLPTVAPDTEARLVPNRFNLPHHDRQLPKFSYGNKSSKDTLCYVCAGPRNRGKFDVKKAEALGLGRGPLRAKIAKGETVTVTVDDGNGGTVERVIKPEDCVGPSEASMVVMIFDVPTPAHIPSLTSAFEESAFYKQFRRANDGKDYTVSTIFHLCGEGVLEDERYKTFLSGFALDVNHVVSSREHAPDPITFTSVAFNQLRLNQLDSEMFPIPKYRLEPKKPLADVAGLPVTTVPMTANLHVDIRPPRPPRQDKLTEDDDRFHPAATALKPLELPGPTLKAFADAREKGPAALVNRAAQSGDDVMIIPLGTGSAVPSKYRNVSSTLVQIPNWGNVLLDAGEGTWGQLTRLLGDDPECSSGAWEALRNLKCLFLSHIHGDHHIGAAKILAMRQKMNPPPSEPLYVIGVRSILLYLREYNEIEDLGLNKREGGVVLILSDALNWRGVPGYWHLNGDYEPWMNVRSSREAATKLCEALGLESFTTVNVYHRTRCYGAVLKHSDGWSIAFSADTMPSDNLVQAGQGATLLIHEATMADEQEQMAKAKAHSTFGQAVSVGQRMGAQNLLLTHFSARYPKMPPQASSANDPESAGGEGGPLLALAFDHMCVRIGEMPKLRAYLPAIEQSFADVAEDDEEDSNTLMGW